MLGIAALLGLLLWCKAGSVTDALADAWFKCTRIVSSLMGRRSDPSDGLPLSGQSYKYSRARLSDRSDERSDTKGSRTSLRDGDDGDLELS